MKIERVHSGIASSLWMSALLLGVQAYPPLLGSADFAFLPSELEERVVCGNGGEIYCYDFAVTCPAGNSCCTVTTCCKPGYACRSGACVNEPV